MKVQILQLDPHDDLASTRDRLAWAQAQRVVLVWPDRARVLRRKLDLVLLRRQAARQGVELGIVTRDPVVLEHAAALGLPCFRSSTRLPEGTWQAGRGFSTSLPERPEPRPALLRPDRSPPRPLPAWSKPLALSILGATLVAALVSLLPSATITVHPETREQSADVILTLDPQAQAPGEDGRIPARQVLLKPAGTLRVTTTGHTLVAGSPARGAVSFTNLTDELVLVPAGTGVLPSGRPDLRFATTADVSLPAGQGASASASVTAVEPGAAGNLPAGTIDAIDGPIGLRAAVTQPEALSGGTEVEHAAVAAADHATALRTLTEQLLSEAGMEIDSQLTEGEALAPASLRVTQTDQREFDRQVGETADSVGLSLTLEVAALIYQPGDIDTAAALLLNARLPAGALAIPDTLKWALDPSAPGSSETLRAHAVQQIAEPISSADVRRAARGRRPSDAAASIAAIPGQAESARIELAPAWWPWVPWMEIRIRVRAPWEGS